MNKRTQIEQPKSENRSQSGDGCIEILSFPRRQDIIAHGGFRSFGPCIKVFLKDRNLTLLISELCGHK